MIRTMGGWPLAPGPGREHRLGRRVAALLAAGLAVLAASPGGASAQQAGAAAPGTVRVFPDCAANNCEEDEFRTEIRFVDWVRDPNDADVQVIITSQQSAAGREYFFDFVGRGAMQGFDSRLTHAASQTDTQSEVLDALTHVLRLGLVPYVVRAGYGDRLEVGMREDGAATRVAVAEAQDDPWDFWIFRLGVDGELDGEERESSHEFRGSFGANRTTAQWKIDLEVEGEFYRRNVELNDGSTFVTRTDDWGFSALVVRSIAPHWSTGSQIDVITSTQFNQDLRTRTALALEWSLFPYEEANRRQLIVHYQLGAARVLYEERTIFDRIQETLTDQMLTVLYDTRQPWGDAFVSVGFANYLDDWSKHRAAVNGGLSFRIFRGLELDVSGGYERIRDQLYLPAGGLSNEEILVRQRQAATGFEYRLDVGLSYSFGSIFNNVINNRFPGRVRNVGGGGDFF